MLIISGVVQVVALVVTREAPHFWMQLVSAVLYVITGFLFVRNLAAAAVATLALLLVVLFIVDSPDGHRSKGHHSR